MSTETAYTTAVAYTQRSVGEGTQKMIDPRSITTIPVGFSPVGVTARNGRFLIAHYFAPAIIEVSLIPHNSGALELKRTDYIGRATTKDGQSVRLYPESEPFADAKRAQCALTTPDGEIWTTRSGETDKIWRMRQNSKKGWDLLDPIQLSQGFGYIESMALLDSNHLLVLRSKQDGSATWLESYGHDGQYKVVDDRYQPPTSPWMYGVGVANGVPWYITDKRATVPFGIYCGKSRIVPGVCGSGLAFNDDGSCLVTQFNADHGPFGEPSSLIYVPADSFV